MNIVAINIVLESFSILILFIVLICQVMSKDRLKRINVLFAAMLVLNIGVLVSDLITWALHYETSSSARPIMLTANFFVYSLGYVILAVFTDYLVTYISSKALISRWITYILSLCCAISVLLVAISQFNNMYYTISETNEYVRGDWYWLSQALPILVLLVVMIVTLLYRKQLGTGDTLALLSYGVFPVIAMTIQIIVYGITLLYLSTTLSMLLIYIVIQFRQEKRLQLKEEELEEKRIALLLSQIQPHFLFNALASIRQLCKTDPVQAENAILHFSSFLRGNMDSLNASQLILFERELAHVKSYLAIEQLRFGKRLSVIYDLQVTNFFMPPLTLLPLVENAVQNGVIKKVKGGTVTISTQRAKNKFSISVADDRNSSEIKSYTEGASLPDGIENAKSRLQMMCGGTLCIESKPEKGFVATITLPEEAEFNVENEISRVSV